MLVTYRLAAAGCRCKLKRPEKMFLALLKVIWRDVIAPVLVKVLVAMILAYLASHLPF